jgi:hypothetical protein
MRTQVSDRKPEAKKRPLGRPRRGWKDMIKTTREGVLWL